MMLRKASRKELALRARDWNIPIRWWWWLWPGKVRREITRYMLDMERPS